MRSPFISLQGITSKCATQKYHTKNFNFFFFFLVLDKTVGQISIIGEYLILCESEQQHIKLTSTQWDIFFHLLLPRLQHSETNTCINRTLIIQDYCKPFLKLISLVDTQRGFLLHKEFQVQEN